MHERTYYKWHVLLMAICSYYFLLVYKYVFYIFYILMDIKLFLLNK